MEDILEEYGVATFTAVVGILALNIILDLIGDGGLINILANAYTVTIGG